MTIKNNVNPTVSVIMPVLNEGKTIRRCLDSLLKGDYKDFEVVVAYGPSKDDTTSILKEYACKYDNICLFENPTGHTAWGRNICIIHSKGKYIMNYSGHVIAKNNLLRVLVDKLEGQPDDVVAVGCSNINPEGQSFVGSASGVVFDSFIGGKKHFVQNAKYDSECFVDHISFSLYRSKVFKEVGKFDTHFWCGQDAELDLRLVEAGYRILYTPFTCVHHFKRNSMGSLFRQMFRYGIARAKMVRKHKGSFKLLYSLGSFFVICVSVLLLLVSMGVFPWQILSLSVFGYVILSFYSTYRIADRFAYILYSPLFAFLIHMGYGIGFLLGVLYGRVIMR